MSARAAELLRSILLGDARCINELILLDNPTLVAAAKIIGEPLVLTAEATIRVMQGLLTREFPEANCQRWASFVRWGIIEGGTGRLVPVDIDFEAEFESPIVEAVARLDELGDIIDGEISDDEARELIQSLTR